MSPQMLRASNASRLASLTVAVENQGEEQGIPGSVGAAWPLVPSIPSVRQNGARGRVRVSALRHELDSGS